MTTSGGEATAAQVWVQLPDLSSRAYEHPADRSALVALRRLSGFDVVLRRLSGLLGERRLRLLYLASAVRVGETQFAGLDRIYADAVRTLDLPSRPELYVAQRPVPQAMTLGLDVPFIVVTTGLLDLLDDDELRFVLGHELGHALSGHAVYQTMLISLLRLSASVGWLPIGYLGLRALIAALREWSRKAELSGDRAGLLAGQDPDAALRTHMKLAGGARLDEMDTEAFLAQGREYDAAGDLRDGVLKLLNLEQQTHPFAVNRAVELRRWIDGGGYDQVLSGDYPRRADDSGTSVGDEVRAAARSYKESMDASADPLVGLLRDLGGGVAGVRDKVTGWMRRPPPPGTSDAPAGPPGEGKPEG
ncbi:MAG TPA: M48 family metallopeptidase [Mycobacteriales bacterium]|nr:M48 family metallopeptidase [Mycobacteriales bacterium]